MSSSTQMMLGALVTILGMIIHTAVLFAGREVLDLAATALGDARFWIYWTSTTVVVVLVVLFGHAIQITMWALMLVKMRAIEDFDDAIYFALVTTTTLGYGDITLGRKYRIFGATGALSGLVTFALSTAFLAENLEYELRITTG
ncbi:MAG: ion channel [Pseudomonadota bacterium]